MLHLFKHSVNDLPIPQQFNNPFYYEPDALSIEAAKEVQNFLSVLQQKEGKMFGVLVVKTQEGQLGYLAAFSGLLNGQNKHPFFVPPIYDLLLPEGYFKIEEEKISQINHTILNLINSEEYKEAQKALEEREEEYQKFRATSKTALKKAKLDRDAKRKELTNALDEDKMKKESQFLKAEVRRKELCLKADIAKAKDAVEAIDAQIEQLKNDRKKRSAELQNWLFDQYRLLNINGEIESLRVVFDRAVHKIPPGGTGECAAPKLLQYAFLHQLTPLAMAEFWWGKSPQNELRKAGYFYPSCTEKCKPILSHMLKGLKVDSNPLEENNIAILNLDILYEDEYIVAINKPEGILSVPGKSDAISVYTWAKMKYPQATGPLIVHRLDMDTSGILLIAKTKEIHKLLQEQFANRTVKKRYVAIVEKEIEPREGIIKLPLCGDPTDRPRQMVNREVGKEAITHYKVVEHCSNGTRIYFFPITGRTHQLRVHAAHSDGLNAPIVGDVLYGSKSKRLCLHAESISFLHPITHQPTSITKEADF